MNDVKCDDFWRWNTSLTIRGRTIWMRTLSASDESERTKAAMLVARKVRTAYLQEDSPERKELLGAYGSVERSELLAVIRAYQTEVSRSLSFREVHPSKDPPEPTDVTLDAVLEAQDEWEKEQIDLLRKRDEWAREQVGTLMEVHEKRDDDKLREIAIEMQISAFATQAYMDEFEAQCLFRSCYTDEKFTKRTFKSVQESKSVDGSVYTQLLEQYRELDRYSLDSESLKN